MRMPAIFFGHGNPMNALLDNPYSQAWSRIGRELPRPKPSRTAPGRASPRQGDQVTFPVEGIDGGSVSMLTVQIG